MKLLRALQVAFGFLTTLPVPIVKDWREEDLRLAVKVYPVVGLVFGLLLVLTMYVTRGLEPLLSAVVLTVAWLALTGGLHFDGFCDMADAALAPRSIEERWRIAKDPRIGSFALMAGLLLILSKVAALSSLVSVNAYQFLLLSPILARTAVTWAMARYPVHDSSLLGRQNKLRWDEIMLPVATGVTLSLLVAVLTSTDLMLLLVVLGLSTFLVAWFLNQKMQGLGGDAYGAIVEINEAVLLVTANF